MKKKVLLSISILIAVFWGIYILLTVTDVTRNIAYRTAKNEIEVNCLNFGAIIEEHSCPIYTERLIFPKYKLKGFFFVFKDESGNTARIEVSSYLPFWVMKSEIHINSQ